MTVRLYDLSSCWVFPNSPQEVWDVIADQDVAWSEWWPGCTLAKPLERGPATGTSHREVLLSTTATLNFKASFGYTLTVSYHPTIVDTPREIVFDADGDLAGSGRVVLSTGTGGQTHMDIEWRVRPTSRWMKLLSPIARPGFTHAHAALMRQGETGLGTYLKRQAQQH